MEQSSFSNILKVDQTSILAYPRVPWKFIHNLIWKIHENFWRRTMNQSMMRYIWATKMSSSVAFIWFLVMILLMIYNNGVFARNIWVDLQWKCPKQSFVWFKKCIEKYFRGLDETDTISVFFEFQNSSILHSMLLHTGR